MAVRIREIVTTNDARRRVMGAGPAALALTALALTGCFKSPSAAAATGPLEATDAEQRSAVSLLWSGAAAAILKPKDPTGTFNVPVTSGAGCSASGTGSYTGTLTGSNVGGAGVVNVNLSASLTKCALLDGTSISATGVTVTGTVAIAADTRATTVIRILAPNVTINDRTCSGGIDVTVRASAPNAPATASGTTCGMVRSLALP